MPYTGSELKGKLGKFIPVYVAVLSSLVLAIVALTYAGNTDANLKALKRDRVLRTELSSKFNKNLCAQIKELRSDIRATLAQFHVPPGRFADKPCKPPSPVR